MIRRQKKELTLTEHKKNKHKTKQEDAKKHGN